MMPTCQEMTELVTDYLAGDLALGTRLRFQLHLGLCRNCRRYLRQMKASVRATGQLSKLSIPAPMMNELLQRFDNWKSR